jgi:antitoxin component YwqK of YwqJK toxin-antitoxin module
MGLDGKFFCKQSINIFLIFTLSDKNKLFTQGMEFRKLILLPLLFFFLPGSGQELGSTHINTVDDKGRKHGDWTVYDGSGELKYKGTYVEGKPSGEFTYFYPGGKVQAEITNIDFGRIRYMRMYHPNGNLMAEGKYILQDKDSTWNYYKESDGSLTLVEHYINGLRQGNCETYYPSGQLMEITPYVDDKKEGPWVQYFSDGSLKAKGSYKDDQLEGLYVLNHLNGNVEISGTYHQGQKDGAWVHLSEIGELMKKEVYKKGILISREEAPPPDDGN